MNAYQTWKSAVDFWAVMAQAPAVVTLRMMDMTRRRATRPVGPMTGPWLAPLGAATPAVTPAATVLPFARADEAPVATPEIEVVEAPVVEPVVVEPAVVDMTVVEPVVAETAAIAAEFVEPVAVDTAVPDMEALEAAPVEVAPVEPIPADILTEASPVAILAATQPVEKVAEALAGNAVPFEAEEGPEETLAVLAGPEAQDLVETAMQPILQGEAEPALVEAAAEAVASPIGGRVGGRRGPAPRRGARPKRVS